METVWGGAPWGEGKESPVKGGNSELLFFKSEVTTARVLGMISRPLILVSVAPPSSSFPSSDLTNSTNP